MQGFDRDNLRFSSGCLRVVAWAIRSEQGDDLPLGIVRNEHPYRNLLPFRLSMHQYPYKIL